MRTVHSTGLTLMWTHCSGASVVSVVSSLVLASCDAEVCPDELWERESFEQVICFSVRHQCSAVHGAKANGIKSDRK